jgi:antitoxin VapB
MALSIKNPETERAARELAQLTGESITVAITLALNERLERNRQRQERAKALLELRELGRECAPLFPAGKSSAELIDELYDKQTGLPR